MRGRAGAPIGGGRVVHPDQLDVLEREVGPAAARARVGRDQDVHALARPGGRQVGAGRDRNVDQALPGPWTARATARCAIARVRQGSARHV